MLTPADRLADPGRAPRHDALMGRPVEEVVRIVRAFPAGGRSGLPDDRDATLSLPQPPGQWRIDVYEGLPPEERYASIRKYLPFLTSEERQKAAVLTQEYKDSLAAFASTRKSWPTCWRTLSRISRRSAG